MIWSCIQSVPSNLFHGLLCSIDVARRCLCRGFKFSVLYISYSFVIEYWTFHLLWLIEYVVIVFYGSWLDLHIYIWKWKWNTDLRTMQCFLTSFDTQICQPNCLWNPFCHTFQHRVCNDVDPQHFRTWRRYAAGYVVVIAFCNNFCYHFLSNFTYLLSLFIDLTCQMMTRYTCQLIH